MNDDNFRILFPNDDGGVAIVIPAPGVSVEEAVKSVPAGKPYQVVPTNTIPEDRTFRNAWTYEV